MPCAWPITSRNGWRDSQTVSADVRSGRRADSWRPRQPRTARGFQHIAIIVSDMARAYARLGEARVRHASPAPQRLPDWNPKAGGIRAFYFRDPDGHFLEVLWFPAGKGDPKWQGVTGRLFL